MFLLLGLIIGFTAAVPVGPVNLFIISQTLKRDFFHGFVAALTAVSLDVIYCAVALIGFLHIKFNLPPTALPFIKTIAGLIIAVIGYKLIRDSRTFHLPENRGKIPPAAAKPIFGVLALYVTNPSLYIFWAAVAGSVTGHGLVPSSGWKAWAFAASCGSGALLWYLMIIPFLAKKQTRIQAKSLRRLLYILGVALILFGAYTVASAFLLPLRGMGQFQEFIS